MKIVFDTNVLLAGIFARGLCEALLDHCLANPEHTAIVSEPILEEFMEKAEQKFHAPPLKVRRVVALFREQMTIVVPMTVSADACRDPDDLAVVGTLIAANADCLVTGDKDLLVLEKFQGLPILTPRQCFECVTRSAG